MLRPVSFSIPSSTELRIVFNKELNNGLGKENFQVNAISGTANDLEIRGVEVSDNYVVVKVSPQDAGSFYVLKLKSFDEYPFSSKDGDRLINDDVSRDLYFVGLKNYNPVRDAMYSNVPSIYQLQNSNINNIISAQAEEIYRAQKDLGRVLSNNFISEEVISERRVRSSGATDRLSNEGVYEITKISENSSDDQLVFSQINYSKDFGEGHEHLPRHPISLKESVVYEEEVYYSSDDNSFRGFRVNLSNANIIKVLSVTHIREDDTEDCNGNLGSKYNLSMYKYSLSNNKYDPKFAFKNIRLDSNQVLLSPFGNISRPMPGDKIVVSYIYKKESININEDSVEMFNIKSVFAENIPTNSRRFFLKNAPIVNQSNEIPTLAGLQFVSQNAFDKKIFKKEVPFNTSKLPSSPGEYSVDYSTGEVIVFGADDQGKGTGPSGVSCSYKYRNTFSRNLDYYVNDNDLYPVYDRIPEEEEATINFNYENVFVEGVDYKALCHKEAYNEHIGSNLDTSFSVRPKNSSITDVYRIYNQTTGEVYTPLYHTRDEIFFTGNRSPEVRTSSGEPARFLDVEEAEVDISSEFIAPCFSVKILSNASNSNISFHPPIPSELLSPSSEDYYARSLGLTGDDDVEDLQIRFFGEQDSNLLISSFAISATATPPSIGETVTIGPRVFSYTLKNNMIMSKDKQSIGGHTNSSLEIINSKLFVNSKFFEEDESYGEFEAANGINSILDPSSSDAFVSNISRLRRPGDYCVDHRNGVIYAAVAFGQKYETLRIRYTCGQLDPYHENLITLSGAFRKLSPADPDYNSNILYEKLETNSSESKILDIESSIIFHKNGVRVLDSNSNLNETCIVLDDHTVLSPYKVRSVEGVYDQALMRGSMLQSSDKNLRSEDLPGKLVSKLVSDGGANIFDKNKMNFVENVIDLKVYKSVRARSAGEQIEIRVDDKNFGSLYSIKHVKSGSNVFDEKLNVEKIFGLDIVNSADIGDNKVLVEIRSGIDLSPVDEKDFLLDSSGARFEILSADPDLSRIIILTPSVNMGAALKPSSGPASVIVKANQVLDDLGASFFISSDTYVKSGDQIEVCYTTDYILPIGSKVGLEISSGDVCVNYTYLYDDIYVSYEYGDNEIDWSESASLLEGQEYFVSYKYGASRRALKDNFGVLTKIPYFQRFPLEADREVYRDGLKGVMSAFTNGAMKPSFETLVESFTGVSPDITESFFGNWILGRDYANPRPVSVSGPINFKEAKFDQGLHAQDGTIVSTPSVSNINLDEGTFSAWVIPNWSGIDNDATLTFDFKDIGEETYSYRYGDNIFDFDSNFSILASKDALGLVDQANGSITISNYSYSWKGSDEEGIDIGAYAIKADPANLNKARDMNLDVEVMVSEFSIPKTLSPPRSKPSDTASNRLPHKGLVGLGKSWSDATRGLGGAGVEIDALRLCSPGFISVGDEERSLISMLNIVPIVNVHNGNVFTFRVGEEHADYNEIPNYDKFNVTRECSCLMENTVPELLLFRDKEYQTIKVELDFEVDLKSFRQYNSIIDDKASLFRAIDTHGSVYKVYAFIDADGNVVHDSVPEKISGFYLDRIPENRGYITGHGANAINDVMPYGEITLAYQTISIITESPSKSVEHLGYKARDYTVDWMSEHVRLFFSREPSTNIVKIAVGDKDDLSRSIQVFYTDLLSKDNEGYIFKYLNLYEWFNINEDTGFIDNISSISKGIYIGSLDKTAASTIDVRKINYNIRCKYSLEDIYIGSEASTPDRLPFSLNKNDDNASSIGLPYLADSREGVFIGYDDLCENAVSGDLGQWILRTRLANSELVPVSVKTLPSGGYEVIRERASISNRVRGEVRSDGEFSSVTRSRKVDGETGCYAEGDCSAHYRYCGGEPLDLVGWSKIEETDSTLINFLTGGADRRRGAWAKHGHFDTDVVDGIFRMSGSKPLPDDAQKSSDGNLIFTRLPCHSGSYEAKVNFRVSSFDYNSLYEGRLSRFNGDISGSLVPISPLHIYDGEINAKLSLGVSDSGYPLLLIFSGDTGGIVDISYFDWDKDGICTLTFSKDDEGLVTISSDYSVISRVSVDDFDRDTDRCNFLGEPFVAIHLFDSSVTDTNSFHERYLPSAIDITLVEFIGRNESGVPTLESSDMLISTDSLVSFEFYPKTYHLDNFFLQDGYVDGYVDGYLDDLSPTEIFDVDEICMSSDRQRFLLDSGVEEGRGRISIFKDGKGFLNFRIIDYSEKSNSSRNVFNIATNIKHFKPGELRHVSASWRLNTIYEKDEMHLFVDGLEAPSLYRFGGPAKVALNTKFSDVSKEVLQSFVVDNIAYGKKYKDGTILAGTNKFISNDADFSNDLIGRTILITGAGVGSRYIGGEYIISSVKDGELNFVSGDNLEPVIFDASDSNIEFELAPAAGLKKKINTDLRNSKFSIYREDCKGNVFELGGIGYVVRDSQIVIVSGEDVISPKYRVNLDTRVIDFVGDDSRCNKVSSVSFADSNIHIKTFGLNFALFNNKVNLSSSSYYNLDKIGNDPNSGRSVLLHHAAEPVSLSDVSIRRIILDRMIPEVSVDIEDGVYVADFNCKVHLADGSSKLSSESGRVSKANHGRLLTLEFDSDNAIFCREWTPDGYADSYAEQMAEPAFRSTVTVVGETVDGTGYEEFEITHNGRLAGKKLFLSVSDIFGSVGVLDPYYEPFVISILESDDITVPNNNGEYAEVYKYVNGSFYISSFGTSGSIPFELHPGNYLVKYPCFMKASLPMIGDDLFFGCDMNGENSFSGIIDELKILSEMSDDTRVNQRYTSGTRSVTRDYLNPNPSCVDDQTLVLINFDNPIEMQSRRLRGKEFLDAEGNFKYKLGRAEREHLLSSVNSMSDFESKMIRMGFDKNIAKETFIEVHKAQGGPLFNEAKLNRSDDMMVSHTSVNEYFGVSGRFFDVKPLLMDNHNSYFRKDSGTIEMWVSPLLSTLNDTEDRVYLDVCSVAKKVLTSSSPTEINLPSQAKKIVRIELISDTDRVSYDNLSDKGSVILDEIYRDKVTGRLSGGTGVDKDFSVGCRLSPDRRRVKLQSALPGSRVSVVVSYVPVNFSGDRISIYKDSFSRIVFSITASGETHTVSKSIDWNRNTWHRIVCSYKANSSSDYIKMFVDGEDCEEVRYGDEAAVYGSGILFGQGGDLKPVVSGGKISVKDEFRSISVGSDIFAEKSSLSRMDNIRISRKDRSMTELSTGEFVDIGFSANLNTVRPAKKDDLTSLIINFDSDENNNSYAVITDPVSGIFNFDIKVLDYFGKIKDEEIEDLIVQLVNRMKPAHTNANVIFPRESC